MGNQPRKLLTTKPELSEQETMQMRLRLAAFDAVSETDVAGVVKKQVEKAKGGDASAAKFVFDYLLGGIKGPVTQQNFYTVEVQGQQPTDAAPGSPAKIQQMRKRVSNGASPFTNGDAHGEEN